MIITAIKQQVKNPERVSVFVDGKYSFSLSLDELLTERLKQGQEIDEARFKALQKLSADGKLRMRALNWIITRPHSTKEFKDYLRRKKVEPDQIDSLTGEFSKKGYLNDEYFAQWFTEQRLLKNKSTRAIMLELRTKGIDSVTIQNIVSSQSDSSTDKVAIQEILNKLRNRSRYQEKEKLIRYLLSKGFDYSLVKEVLDSEQAQ